MSTLRRSWTGTWFGVSIGVLAVAFAACAPVPSPAPPSSPTPQPSPAISVEPTEPPTPEPSPTAASFSVACVFGNPQRDVCQQAVAAAMRALPADHAPVTSIRISNAGTLSICHFGDPAWTPAPNDPGCTVIADVSMGDQTVSMVLDYDQALDDWRLDFIRDG